MLMTMVYVRSEDAERLVRLAAAEDRPLASVVGRALEVYEREVAFNRSVGAKVAEQEAAEVEKAAARTRARVEADAAIAAVKRGHAAAFEEPKAAPLADIAEQFERVKAQQESRSPGRKVKDRGVPVVEDKPCPHPPSKRVNKSGLVGCDRCGAVKTVSGEWRVP